MGSRLELHEKFKKLTKNVYYQPPTGERMQYPAIRYARTSIDNLHADDGVYKQSHAYIVTVIDRDPDSKIVDEISKFPTCRFIRHDTIDGLNHDVFIIYHK